MFRGQHMKQRRKLVKATVVDIGGKVYQDGLQAMWEARWRLIGANGAADWLQRHGAAPPEVCPLVKAAAARHGVRRIQTGSLNTALARPGRLLRREH